MGKPQGMTKIRYLWLLIFVASIGCSTSQLYPAVSAPTIAPTPTSEQLQLVNGEYDACALFTATEIEPILGLKTTEETISSKYATGCRYVTTTSEPQEVLVIFICTDETLRNAGMSHSASSWYEQEKELNLNIIAPISEAKIEDVPNLGDKAYYKVSAVTDLYILKNNVEYIFDTAVSEWGESNSVDKLLALAELAIHRMP